jgi:hypothetical protein
MSRILIEGFEGQSMDCFTAYGSAPAFISTAAMSPMTPGYAIYFNSGAGGYWAEKTLAGPQSQLYLSMKFRVENMTPFGGYSTCVVLFRDSAYTVIGTLMMQYTTRCLSFNVGSVTDSGFEAVGTRRLEKSVAYLLEIYYKPLNSGGEFTVKLNGTTELTYTGDTTAGLEDVQTVYFGQSGNYRSMTVIDDLVLDDANWIGNSRVGILAPTAAGGETQWDPSAGSNYQCVDERPHSDADYISTNITNEVDTFATDWSAPLDVVKSLQVTTRSGFSGNPTPQHQVPVLRLGGNDYPHATPYDHLDLSVKRFDRLWELNPADSQPFEFSDLDALEIGIKAVA